ncbi:MAG TPA: serine/threonine-protein kinase [Pirellulaceae bacterium]|nr:serine/threonine-protein kinase [Pirellulaceae bacterium]
MEVTASIRYKKVRQIGHGQGMNSEVYLAHDKFTGREIVVKEISKSLLRAQSLKDYFTEAKSMAGSQDPANVVPIHYACNTHSHVGIAMPYYKNGSLQDRIADGPLAVATVIKVAQGVLNGVSKIHQANVVHFDIKPSNILFSDADKPMVADFGQARAVAASGTVDMPPLYPDAPPPEVYNSNAIGTRATDIYHMGLLLYRAVNGDPFFKLQTPFSDIDMMAKTVAGKFPDRQLFMPHVPKYLRTIIRKALSVAEKDRHQSAAELSDDLTKVRLVNHWTIDIEPSGRIRWESAPAGRNKLLVELARTSKGYDVRVFSIGKQQRAKKTDGFWQGGLSHGRAMKHLKFVFEKLG